MSDRKIVWVASFPKSGNTWLRFIVFFLNHQRAPANSVELDNYISRHHKPGPDRYFVKTHAAAFNRENFFEETSGAIYVHRHPLDVLCSALNYAQLIGEIELDEVTDRQFQTWKSAWISDYLMEGAPAEWMRAHETDTWVRNVESWNPEALPFPVLRISYQEMLTNTDAVIRSIASFLSIDASAELIRSCRDATSFSNLRQFEENEVTAADAMGLGLGRFSGPARRKAFARGIRFFNTGRSGYYADVLDDATIVRAEHAFGTTAERVGYDVPFARSQVQANVGTRSSHLEIWSQLSAEISEFRSNVKATEDEVKAQRLLNESLASKLRDQQAETEQLAKNLALAREEVAKLEAGLVELQQSISWRLTRPLRDIQQFAGRGYSTMRALLGEARNPESRR